MPWIPYALLKINMVFYIEGKFFQIPSELKSPTGRDADDALKEDVTDMTARQRQSLAALFCESVKGTNISIL